MSQTSTQSGKSHKEHVSKIPNVDIPSHLGMSKRQQNHFWLNRSSDIKSICFYNIFLHLKSPPFPMRLLKDNHMTQPAIGHADEVPKIIEVIVYTHVSVFFAVVVITLTAYP